MAPPFPAVLFLFRYWVTLAFIFNDWLDIFFAVLLVLRVYVN